NLSSAWERFRSDTLPSLVDLTWFRSWWGQGSTPFESWWSWARGLISDETEAKLDPVRQGVNRNASWLEMIKSFIDDPEDFLYRAVDRIIERFW
ncbi:MAG: hypothetical protein KKB38_20380, partial [Gammaproteobacteria bacterium]|nr:hypothetical protein [Gammaproteobacteria bacterium]